MQTFDLTNQLLIAMPTLMDPNFHRTVTVVCAHNEDGAMGIIVNRPTQIKVGSLLERLELKAASEEIAVRPVFIGGPVQRDWGLVLHQPVCKYEHTLSISDDLAISVSRDIFIDIAAGDGPESALVALGYAGWGAGQLEVEIAQNSWLVSPMDLRVVFHTPPDQCWSAAAALLGFDLHQLSRDVGHA